MSQRRSAQLGLVAGGMILIASVVVLVSGSSDQQTQALAQTGSQTYSSTNTQTLSPLASSPLTSFPISITKR